LNRYSLSLGIAAFDSSSFRSFPAIRFAYDDTGNYYSLNMRRPRFDYNWKDDRVVCTFGHSRRAFILDRNQKVSVKNIESYILDTIYPLKQYYDEFFDYNRGEYRDIIFDPNGNGYYRIIRVGNNRFTDYRGLPGKPYPGKEVYVFQYLDSNLDLVGEGILPAGAAPRESRPLIPFRNMLLMYNEPQSLLQNKVVFDVCEREEQLVALTAYEERVKELMQENGQPLDQSYSAYLKALRISLPSSGACLVFNTEKSC
jgi:hypothetical protein